MTTSLSETFVLPATHPVSDIMSAYAAGSLEPAVALVIATHLEMCPHCLSDYEAALAIGGAMLRRLDVPASSYADASYGQLAPSFDMLQALVSEHDTNEPSPPITAHATTALPKVLQDFLTSTKGAAISTDGSIAATLATLPWQKRTKNLRFAHFDLSQAQQSEHHNSTIELEGGCNFIELQAGSSLPSHTHKGEEYLVVLTGNLQDENGTYQPGDLVYADSAITHTPKALTTCICLAATTAPVKFTGLKGSVLNMLGLGRL